MSPIFCICLGSDCMLSFFYGKGMGLFISTNKNKHGGVSKGDEYQGNRIRRLSH